MTDLMDLRIVSKDVDKIIMTIRDERKQKTINAQEQSSDNSFDSDLSEGQIT